MDGWLLCGNMQKPGLFHTVGVMDIIHVGMYHWYVGMVVQ